MQQAFHEVWAVDASNSPNSYIPVKKSVICRNVLFSTLAALTIAAICIGLTSQLDDDIDNNGVISVNDTISQIEVRNCFVTIDTNFDRDSTFVKIDKSDNDQVLHLSGSNTGLCSAKISISTARSSPLTIRGSDSTILLSSSSNIPYPFDLTVKSPRSATGTVRILIGGAAFNTLNLDTSSALVVIDANTRLPEVMNINVDFGVVAVAAPNSSAASSMFQKLSFEANVTEGGYCLTPESVFSDLTYTINTTTTTSADGNTTVVKSLITGELLPSVTARTSTLNVNSSSFYLTRKTVEEKDVGSLMNETSRLRPLVETYLLGSRDFSDTQVNSQYVQAIEVVAPYAGAIFLNSNSRFAIQFGPALLSLLSGFQLSPSYRRLNSALSHYTCMNDTFIDRISAAISVTPFDSLDDTATNVALTTERYLPDQTIADVYNSIVNLTADASLLTAFSLINFDLEATTNVMGRFKTVEFDGDEFTFVDLKRSVGQWILLVSTLVLGIYVAVVLILILLFFRGDLLKLFYLQESRDFIRQIVRTGVGRCAYHLYRSLYAFHAMCAVHFVRHTSFVFRTLVPTISMSYFAHWMLRVVKKPVVQKQIENENNKDESCCTRCSDYCCSEPNYYELQQRKLEDQKPEEKSRIITVDQLLDLYSSVWALRHNPRIDYSRSSMLQILKHEGFEVKVLEVDVIMGIASAVTNTEIEGEYLFDDLYRTTPNEYDQVTAHDIANTQFLNNPVANTSVTQVLEAKNRGLAIKKVEEECVINAHWSPAASAEKISLRRTLRAEASFASFPSYVELRPDVEFFDDSNRLTTFTAVMWWLWNKVVGKLSYLLPSLSTFFENIGNNATTRRLRHEVEPFLFYELSRIVIWSVQSTAHVCIAVFPLFFIYVIFEEFVKETTKYSLSARSFIFIELLFGIVNLEVDPDTLQPVVSFILIGFFFATLIEPFFVIICRSFYPLAITKLDYVIRYPISVLVAFVYVMSSLLVIAYWVMVLLWWGIGAITSPNTMLAFAASAFTIVGVLFSTYTTLKTSRETITNRIKERILETLLDILKRSGLYQFSDGSLDSDDNSELTVGLLADVAAEKPQALAQLGKILDIPDIFIICILAVQSRDPLKLEQASEHLLKLCKIPPRYTGVVSLILMKAMNLPVTTTEITEAFTDIVPDPTARNLLNSAHHGLIPLVDALLNHRNGKSEIAFARIFDGLIAVAQNFAIENSKGKLTREMVQPVTEIVYASFGDGQFLNLTSSSSDSSSSSLKSGSKSALRTASSLATQLHSSISNSANKADFILSNLLILLEEVVPLVLEDADYEFEKLFLVLVEGVKLALGREDNQFVMHLLYLCLNNNSLSLKGLTEDPFFNKFKSEECLRLWRVVSKIDPIAQKVIEVFFRDEFEELDATPNTNPPDFSFLPDIVTVLSGFFTINKNTTAVNRLRALHSAVFATPENCTKIINSLGLSGSSHSKTTAIVEAARKIIKNYLECHANKKPVINNIAVSPEQKPLATWLAFQWICVLRLAFPDDFAKVPVHETFTPDISALENLTNIPSSALEIFSSFSEIALKFHEMLHNKFPAISSTSLTPFNCFEMIRHGVPEKKRVVPLFAKRSPMQVLRVIFAKHTLTAPAPTPATAPTPAPTPATAPAPATAPTPATAPATAPTPATAPAPAPAPTPAPALTAITAPVERMIVDYLQELSTPQVIGGANNNNNNNITTTVSNNFVKMLFRVIQGSVPDLRMITGVLNPSQPRSSKTAISIDDCVGQSGVNLAKMILSNLLTRSDSLDFAAEKAVETTKKIADVVLKAAWSSIFDQNQHSARFLDTAIEVGSSVVSLLQNRKHNHSAKFAHEEVKKLANKLGITDRQLLPILQPKEFVERICGYASFLIDVCSVGFTFDENHPLFKSFVNKCVVGTSVDRRFVTPYLKRFFKLDKTGQYVTFKWKTRVGYTSHWIDVVDGTCGPEPKGTIHTLRYPVTTREFLQSRQKKAMLFCSLVRPHPFCLEALYIPDLLCAIENFLEKGLDKLFVALKSNNNNNYNISDVETTRMWKLLADCVRTTCPIVADINFATQGNTPRYMAECKNLQDYLDFHRALSTELIRAGICVNNIPQPATDITTVRQGFVPTPEFESFADIVCNIWFIKTSSGMPIKAMRYHPERFDESDFDEKKKHSKSQSNSNNNSQTPDDASTKKKRREKEEELKAEALKLITNPNNNNISQWGFYGKHKDEGGASSDKDYRLQTAYEEANALVLYPALSDKFPKQDDNEFGKIVEPILQLHFDVIQTFFRLHGMKEFDVIKNNMNNNNNTNNTNNAAAGGNDADNDRATLANQMSEISALICLMIRRTDAPRSTINRLVLKLPESVADLVRDILYLKCLGIGSIDFKIGKLNTLSSAFKLLRLPDSTGNNLSEILEQYLVILNSKNSGYSISESMDGGNCLLSNSAAKSDNNTRLLHWFQLLIQENYLALGTCFVSHLTDKINNNNNNITSKQPFDLTFMKSVLFLLHAKDDTHHTKGKRHEEEVKTAYDDTEDEDSDWDNGLDEEERAEKQKERSDLRVKAIDEKRKKKQNSAANTATNTAANTGANQIKNIRSKILNRKRPDLAGITESAYCNFSPMLRRVLNAIMEVDELNIIATKSAATLATAKAAANPAAAAVAAATAAHTAAAAAAATADARKNCLLKIIDPSLVGLLSNITQPLKALLDLVDQHSIPWTSANLAISLMSREWNTAADCFSRLFGLLGGPPTLGAVLNIIVRSSANALVPENDKRAVASEMLCSFFDLMIENLRGEMKTQAVPALKFLKLILSGQRPTPRDIQKIVYWGIEQVLKGIFELDKTATEKYEVLRELIDQAFQLQRHLEHSSSANDVLEWLPNILTPAIKLIVPKEHVDKALQIIAFFKDHIVPIFKKDALSNTTSRADSISSTILHTSVDFALLMKIVEWASKSALEIAKKDAEKMERGVEKLDDSTVAKFRLSPDVATKIMLAAKLAQGDLSSLSPFLATVGINVPDGTIRKLLTIVEMLKGMIIDRKFSVDAAIDYGADAAANAVKSKSKQLIDAMADFVFDQFDHRTQKRISFNAFQAFLVKLNLQLPAAEARAIFDLADGDKSGYVTRPEFHTALNELQTVFSQKVIFAMGLSDRNITYALAVLFLHLVLFLGFILIGVQTFSDGSTFTAVTSGALPFIGSTLATGAKSVDSLFNAADRAVGELIDVLKKRG